MTNKHAWEGKILAIQPRIRLLRSFDQRSHSYLGYILHLNGFLGGVPQEFLVAIGKAAEENLQFRSGDMALGESHPVQDNRTEVAKFYKTSKLTLLERSVAEPALTAVSDTDHQHRRPYFQQSK